MKIHERWLFLTVSSLAYLTNRIIDDQTSALVARLCGYAKACKNGKDSSCLHFDSVMFNGLSVAHDWSACIGAFCAGFVLRKYGINVVSMGSATFMLLGLLLITVGPYLHADSNRAFAVMILGEISFGFGFFLGVVIALQVMSHWFFQKEMGLAYAVFFSSGKLGVIFATAAVGSIVEVCGLQQTLWITFCIGLIGPIGTIIAGAIYDRHAHRQAHVKIIYRTDSSGDYDFRKITLLSRDFWIVCCIIMLYYATSIGTLIDFPKFLTETFHYSESLAGLVTSIIPLLALLAPLFGLFVDRCGHRSTLTFCATGLILMSFVLQSLVPALYPEVTAFVIGLAYAICSASIWSSISVIEHPKVVGIALGVGTGAERFGIGTGLLVSGFVLETGKGRWERYFVLQAIFVGTAWILSILSFVLDMRNHGGRLLKPHYYHPDEDTKEMTSLLQTNTTRKSISYGADDCQQKPL